MDAARQKEIASKGGRAAHAKGTAHEWSSDEARVAGRKGGEVVSRDRAHMAAIGREGGEARGANARAARASRFSDSRDESRNESRNESSRNSLSDRELSLNVSRDGLGERMGSARTPSSTSGGERRSDSRVDLGGSRQPRGTDETRSSY
jgi:general stress protein YciG